MAKNQIKIHPEFKLNGLGYSESDLKTFANELVREGKPFEKDIGKFLSAWFDNTANLEVKTSGSTGIPKLIVLQKKQMVNSALATARFFNLKAKDSSLLCLSATYIAGKMMLVRALVLGLHLDYVEPSSSPVARVSKNYDFVAMVPLQLENSIAKIEQIKTLIVGGAAVSSKLREQTKDKNTVIFETYGMTETISHVAVKRLKDLTGPSRSYFKALPNVKFSIDEKACLVIAAPKVSDRLVITNDVVQLLSDSEFEWLGRYDNIINSGGIKLFPERIEAAIAPFLNNRFFVTGMPDEKLGEQLVLIVEGIFDTNKLKQQLTTEAQLNRYEVPKHVYALSQFMETDTGKIRRKETLKMLQN